MTTGQLLETPLHQWHVDHGGRMVEFAGWSMPVQYASIVAEHHHTRNAVGLFDVSHMGRLFFEGPAVDRLLDSISTRRILNVPAGKVRYSLICNQEGGILDDVLIYHLAVGEGFAAGDRFDAVDGQSDSFYMMVCNASNRSKIVAWIEQHIGSNIADGEATIELKDSTESTAMIAVQGPQANAIVAKIASVDPATLGYYEGCVCKIDGVEGIVSRTGYTGEDGCEIIVANESALAIWQKLYGMASEIEGGATGLAARDTLRLEAAMPLYGHELNEDINAAQTDLRFAINSKDRSFVGRDGIAKAKTRVQATGDLPVRVGLVLAGRRPAREGCQVLAGDLGNSQTVEAGETVEAGMTGVAGERVGHLTSGTLSPTLGVPIAMGYVAPQYAAVGTELLVDIRGKSVAAKVVDLPFYKRPGS